MQFFLDFIEHFQQGVADRHGAARTAAGIAARRPAHRIGRAVACRIELVDDGIDIDAGAGTDGNHARQADHKVVAAACRALAEVCFQESPCLGIEESHAVQAAATRDEFTFLADDVVVDADDFTAFQAFTSRRYTFFFFMGRQDTGPLAAVAEQGQALTALFIGQEVEVFRIFDGKAVGHVDCRTDGRIDVLLPGCLHFDAFMIIQGQGRDEVFRKLAVVFDVVLLHIAFDNRRIDLIIDVRPVEGFRLAFIEVRINRFDAAGNAEHRRQSPRRGDGQELGIAQAVFLDQFGRRFRRVGFEIRRTHDFIDMAFFEGTALMSQFCRRSDSRIGHGKADIMTEGDGVCAAISQAHLDEHVAEAHDAQADLAPGFDAFPLFFQGMQGQAFFEDIVQGPDGNADAALEFIEIKGSVRRKGIVDEVGQVHAAQETGATGRQRFFGAGIDAGKGKFRRVGQEVPRFDAVPEQGARFGIVPVRFCDQAEDVGCIDQAFNDLPRFLSLEMEAELFVFLDGFHEFIAQADGNIGLSHLIEVCLELDEIQDIRMGTVDGNHQGPAAAVLADQFRDQGIEGHKGNRTARFFGRVVDARPFRTQAGNIDAAATAVAVGPGQFPGPVEDAFDAVFRRRHDVTVGQGNLLAFIFQSPVGQDAAAKEKFLGFDQIGDFFIAATDAADPMVKGFAVIAIFILPNIQAELILCTEPFLFVHNLPPPLRIANA